MDSCDKRKRAFVQLCWVLPAAPAEAHRPDVKHIMIKKKKKKRNRIFSSLNSRKSAFQGCLKTPPMMRQMLRCRETEREREKAKSGDAADGVHVIVWPSRTHCQAAWWHFDVDPGLKQQKLRSVAETWFHSAPSLKWCYRHLVFRRQAGEETSLWDYCGDDTKQFTEQNTVKPIFI